MIILAACSAKKENTSATETNEINKEFLSHIETVEAIPCNPEETLTLTGKVECDPENIVRYIPLVHGIVEHTNFSLGDKVRKGQPLLDIRSSELSALLSEFVTLESELEVSKRNLQNTQSMYDDKMLSEKELLEAKVKFRQDQAAFERVKNDLSLYQYKDNGVFSILAPMSGYIVDKQVASGSPVSSEGNPLFVIADLNKVWITANVYSGDLQMVRENTPVKITALSYPDEVFTGKIDALSQVFDPEEKVLKARIVMSNAQLKFKPEMAVVIRLENKISGQQQIAIPSQSLIFDDDKYFVIVEESPEHFKICPVELSGNRDQKSYIRSGLESGDKVVVKNQLLIFTKIKS